LVLEEEAMLAREVGNQCWMVFGIELERLVSVEKEAGKRTFDPISGVERGSDMAELCLVSMRCLTVARGLEMARCAVNREGEKSSSLVVVLSLLVNRTEVARRRVAADGGFE
jgi:hypothetical protein